MVACSSNAQNLRTVKLPSGKQIRVIAEGPIHFAQGPPALMLQYQTELKVSDAKTLRKEVDEIWTAFKADVEKGNYTSAIVSAREVPSGAFIKKSSGYNFVFQKASDGTWTCLEDSKR